VNYKDFQVAVLYNSDPTFPRGEAQDLLAVQATQETAQSLFDALQTLGYRTLMLGVDGCLEQVREQLAGLSPQSTFFFNICDSSYTDLISQAYIARVLDELSFSYSGSDADTIAFCIHKAHTKQRLLAAGLPTPPFQVFEYASGPVHLEFPVIVKPLYEDGSQGISLESVASNSAEMFARIDYILKIYRQPALVEAFILGREIAVSLWGNETVEVLPVIEHDYFGISNPLERLLTFQLKWFPDCYYHDIRMHIPAPLSSAEEQSIKETAIAAYRTLGLRDFGRMDIRYHHGIPYIIDVNEIPDLHPESGFILSAIAAGYSFETAVDKILDLALKRVGWR
jgi:D-alanine-D-alanine ligase